MIIKIFNFGMLQRVDTKQGLETNVIFLFYWVEATGVELNQQKYK